jgi:hypothetical protein
MNRHLIVVRFTTAVAFLLLLAASPWRHALAQTTTGSLRGVVRDQGGAPVTDANVIARDIATGFERGTQTRETGFYNLAGLTPGRYTISVRRIGFSPVSRTQQVGIGQTLTLDFSLTTASITLTAVTVVAEPEVIETRTSEVATNVTRDQIEKLPSRDRNFLELTALAPGVTLEGSNQADAVGRTFKAGAQPAQQINVFIDGASYKNDLLKGGVAGQDASRGNPFPQGAVQEFRVITQNYKAEYQKASSAIITAATKSGTNAWTGDAFYTRQDKGLVALDQFQSVSDVKDRAFRKPEYKRNLFGFSVGGPIIRDRMHLFGTFEANNQIRSQRVNISPDTIGGPNGGRYPALDSINWNAFNGEFESPFKSTLFFGKLSYMQSQRSNLELSLNTRNESDIREFGGLSSYQSAKNIKNSVTTGILKHRLNVGSMLNEALVSYQNYHTIPKPNDNGVANRFYGMGCCVQIGTNQSSQDFTQRRLAFRDDITWSGLQAAGQHVVKAGLTIDFLNYDIIKRNNEIPRFVYEEWWHNYEIPQRVEFQSGDPNFSAKNSQMGLYLQDDWAPTERLTFNLGVRWDYESGMLNYDYVTPKNVVDSLTKYSDRLIGYKLDPKRYFSDGSNREPWKGAIQPRLGFSYAVDKAARTTVFGGWGIFIDRTLYDQALEERFALQHPSYVIRFRPVGSTEPGAVDWNPIYLTEGKPALDALVASTQANAPEVKLLPNDLRPPSSQHTSVGVRQLLGDWGVDATYTYIHSENVFTFYWANQNFVCPDRSFAVAGCFQGNGIPGFSSILLGDNAGETWYYALQLKIDRAFKRNEAGLGWGLGAAFTMAKRESQGFNDDFSFPTPVDYPRQVRNNERGRLVTNWILQSPRLFDIQFSGVLTYATGTPIDVGDRFGCPVAAAAAIPPRCNNPNPIRYGAFTPPASGNLDLRLRKDFAIGRQSVGITADVFNALNNQSFGCYNTGNPNDLAPGGCMSADPQRVQLGISATY